jgi:predicted sugar kinase
VRFFLGPFLRKSQAFCAAASVGRKTSDNTNTHRKIRAMFFATIIVPVAKQDWEICGLALIILQQQFGEWFGRQKVKKAARL